MFTFVSRTLGAVALLVLAACSGSNPHVAAPATKSVPLGHLYVTDGAALTGDEIQAFALPLTSSSTPTATITGVANPGGVLVDSVNARLFVGEANVIAVYALPLTSASTPAFTMPLPGTNNAGNGMTFDSAGNLYVTSSLGNGKLTEYSPPFSSASTPSVLLTTFTSYTGVAISSAASQLYLADSGNAQVAVYALPVTPTSTPVFTLTGLGPIRSVALDPTGRLVVAGNNAVYVYVMPVTASSTPSITIPQFANATAFDALGDMYVATDSQSSGVAVYAAPLTSSSTIATHVPVDQNPTSVAVGE